MPDGPNQNGPTARPLRATRKKKGDPQISRDKYCLAASLDGAVDGGAMVERLIIIIAVDLVAKIGCG